MDNTSLQFPVIIVPLTWTDYKTYAQIAKELKITSVLDKLLEYKRSWIQHVVYIRVNTSTFKALHEVIKTTRQSASRKSAFKDNTQPYDFSPILFLAKSVN